MGSVGRNSRPENGIRRSALSAPAREQRHDVPRDANNDMHHFSRGNRVVQQRHHERREQLGTAQRVRSLRGEVRGVPDAGPSVNTSDCEATRHADAKRARIADPRRRRQRRCVGRDMPRQPSAPDNGVRPHELSLETAL